MRTFAFALIKINQTFFLKKMTIKALTTSDVMNLISEYKSEIRRLHAKISFCENFISELEEMLTKFDDNAITHNVDIPETAMIVRKEIKTRKPYPLSEWDIIILNIIKENGRAMLSKDVYEKTFIKAKEEDIFIDEVKSKAKINQCLVKLTNRRHDLVKVRYKGQGFAYCLPEWTNDSGRLKSEFSVKE